MTPKRVNLLLKGALVAIVLATIGGLYLADKKLDTVASQTARYKAEAEVAQKQYEAYKLTKVKVDSLDYVDDLAARVLPEDKEQSVIVAELSQFALRAKMSVSQINFPDKEASSAQPGAKNQKAQTPKGVQVIPINVQLKAGSKYENLLEFLRYVENNRRKMQIASIDLKPDTEDRSRLSEVTVILNLYAKQAEQSPGAKQ